MLTQAKVLNGFLDRHLVRVTAFPDGRITAQVVGLPEVTATAGSREEALDQVRTLLRTWFESGQLAVLEIPTWVGFGHASASDPCEQEYLAELARARQKDLEETIANNDQQCSSSSSTQTT